MYWREFGVSRRQAYRPYVLWRRHAFSGKTINVDADGVRLTPGAVCGPSSFKVFVLGGSTVWGTGAADWNTLPAHLQTELQRVSARPVCVVNFGESAWVSTQSVLQLLLQLQAGNVPDLVICTRATTTHIVRTSLAGPASTKTSHKWSPHSKGPTELSKVRSVG